MTASLALFLLFSIVAALGMRWKVLAISWVAFASMGAAIPLGVYAARNKNNRSMVVGYGLASGAMIASTAIFLIPASINYGAVMGIVGIAAGLLIGFSIHSVSRRYTARLWNIDPIVWELLSHALTAGLIIGTVYALQPGFSLLLGIAIISHKAPAGYAAAHALAVNKKAPGLLLLPACAVGLTALPMSLLALGTNAWLHALIFGIATGIFLHIAFHFLPIAGVRDNFHQPDGKTISDHTTPAYRFRAAVSTLAGGAAVFLLWYFIH